MNLVLHLASPVVFHGYESNGANAHAAIVTRVWADRCVNVTVFPDQGAPKLFSSVEVIYPGQKPVGPTWVTLA